MEYHRIVIYKDRYFSRVKLVVNLSFLNCYGPWNTHQNTLGVCGTIILLFHTRYTCSRIDGTSTMSDKKRIILGCLLCLSFHPVLLATCYDLPGNMDKAKLELAAMWKDPLDLLWDSTTAVSGAHRIGISHIVFAVQAVTVVVVWHLLFWISKTCILTSKSLEPITILRGISKLFITRESRRALADL